MFRNETEIDVTPVCRISIPSFVGYLNLIVVGEEIISFDGSSYSSGARHSLDT